MLEGQRNPISLSENELTRARGVQGGSLGFRVWGFSGLRFRVQVLRLGSRRAGRGFIRSVRLRLWGVVAFRASSVTSLPQVALEHWVYVGLCLHSRQ